MTMQCFFYLLHDVCDMLPGVNSQAQAALYLTALQFRDMGIADNICIRILPGLIKTFFHICRGSLLFIDALALLNYGGKKCKDYTTCIL